MKIKRDELSKTENCVLFAICFAALLLMLMGPEIWAFITKKPIEGGHAVPKSGTIEYTEFMEKFEAEHGRKWDINDELTASRNGAYVLIGILGQFISIVAAFNLIHDLRCWKQEKSAYRDGLIVELPMSKEQQLYRVITSIIPIILFGGFAWFVMPFILSPIV